MGVERDNQWLIMLIALSGQGGKRRFFTEIADNQKLGNA
jgi:hypothetical protein